MQDLIRKYNDAANYGLGRKGNLANVCAIGISLAEKCGKLEEVKTFLNELPPAAAFKNPSLGLDELIAGLNNLQATQTIENNIEIKTR
mgnify:CR=1 FL=1